MTLPKKPKKKSNKSWQITSLRRGKQKKDKMMKMKIS